MNKLLLNEIRGLIKELKLNCTIREFKDKVDWNYISYSQELSEDFIREFKDKINWFNISYSQKLSKDFIREFKDKIYWNQNLLEEVKDEVVKEKPQEVKPSDNHKCISRLFGLVRCHKFVSVYNEKEEIPESVIRSASRYGYAWQEENVLKAGKLKHKELVSTYCKYCGLKV